MLQIAARCGKMPDGLPFSMVGRGSAIGGLRRVIVGVRRRRYAGKKQNESRGGLTSCLSSG